jgi:PelA/Pel-15E family pectate lyase
VGARTFELACISPADTTDVVRFLMRLEPASPEVVRAIDAAVAWLRAVQLNGIRVERVPAPPAEFFRHKTDFDVVVVADEKARPLWARMVEVGSNRPIFASRDGIKVYALAEVDRERRTGSGWYVTTPQRLLEVDYPKWREAREKGRKP